MLLRAALLTLVLGALCDGRLAGAADETPQPIAGLGPVGPVVKLHGNFKFTEGPAGDRQGNVYFSDIPANRIYKVDSAGMLSVFREPSNSANGLKVSGNGEIYGCEMEGRVVAMSPDGKKVRPLAETYQGKRFNAPNDLVIDKTGGVYFTDPHFKSPEPLPQGKTAVYYISPAGGTVTRLIDDLKVPYGVTLSPDEKTLYVIPTLQAEMMAYPVTEPGKIGAGQVFCTLKQPAGKNGTGGDGLAIDEQGNLYITSGLGLQVFSPAGKALGIIPFPEQPANATFAGPEGKTLYVTARTSLYTVPMSVKGHVFPAGGK